MHSAIYDTYLVWGCYIDLWSIGGGVGSVCHGYICILLYVKLMQCSGFPEIYAQLWGVHLPWVYVHSSICETYLV